MLTKEDKEVIQAEMFALIELLLKTYPKVKYTEILKLLTQAINMAEVSLLVKGAFNNK
jgi:hypothetical protein